MNIFKKLCYAFPAAWQWYKGLYKGRKWYIKTLSALCTLVVLFFLYLLMVNFNFLWLFGKSPSMSDVRNTHPFAIPIPPKHQKYTVPTANSSENSSAKTECPSAMTT